ncbi:MAG TPA: hypothetical protein VJH23_00160 [archaeon]|nr:hypothetical protein [archaeon]
MNLFRIGNGPWEKLFSGVFQEHDIELYSNPDRILLVLIYEKKLDVLEGAIAEVYKVFHAKGEVEAFTETLPREALIITKHDERSTMKFLLLGSKPNYVRWIEAEFIEEVDAMVKRLSTSSAMMKDVSKAYELTLSEIGESEQEVQTAFFAQPMLVPILTTASHGSVFQEPQIKPITKGEIMLGITRDRSRVIEPLALFTKTIITDGEEKDRNRALQVIGESALLSNVPAVFVDFNRKFIGIGEANKNAGELQKYDVNVDALGFPARVLKSRESIRIDLNLLNTEGTAELFGVGEKDFPRILRMALDAGPVATMNELVERVSNTAQTEEFSEFKIRKAARILKLMDVIYPNLFGGQNDIEDMAKQGLANIARASLLEFEAMDQRASLLLFHSVMRGIYEYAKKKGKSSEVRLMVIIPHVHYLKGKGRQQIDVDDIASILKDLQGFGVSFAIAADSLIDVNQEIKNVANAKLNVVSENDLGVQLINRKAYRVLVRPTLSRQTI